MFAYNYRIEMRT